MKKQLLSGVAAVSFIAAGGTAYAADLPVKAAPPPVYGCIWNGFYVGGHIGFGEPRASGTYFGTSEPTGFKHGPSGVLGGVQAGQNWCQNTFVYGWEGDVSFMKMKQTAHSITDDDTLTNEVNLLASLRARLGMTIDPNTMVYLTGGPAYVHGSVKFFDADGPTTIKSNISNFGGVVGAGVETALTHNLFWRTEGLFYFFNARKHFDDGNETATDRLSSVWTLRTGLSYKFGDSGKAPIAMPAKASVNPAAAFDWSGLYVGGGVGWQGSKIGLSDPGAPVSYKPIHDSVALSGHVGAQTQFDRLVLGIEGGYLSGFGDTSLGPVPSISIFIPGSSGTADTKFKNAWSIGGRAGWSMGRWMPYLTAGWAQGKFGFHADDGFSVQTANAKTDGAYFGGGIDFALGSNWIFGVEYRYYDFKTKTVTASNNDTIRFDPKTETIMARLSYKFDWSSKGPVVAKY